MKINLYRYKQQYPFPKEISYVVSTVGIDYWTKVDSIEIQENWKPYEKSEVNFDEDSEPYLVKTSRGIYVGRITEGLWSLTGHGSPNDILELSPIPITLNFKRVIVKHTGEYKWKELPKIKSNS